MPKKGKTAQYYATHPEARKKKYKYDKKYGQDPEQVDKRVELNREARKRGIYGKRKAMGKDLAHTKNGLVLKNSSKNRGSKSDMPGDKRARGGKKK